MTVKEKTKELLHMDDRQLVDRILAFPDRERLNRDEEGKRRKYPSAEMAVRARRSMEKDPSYQISDKQKWAMADSFAKFSSDQLKVAGIKFAKADPNDLVKNPILEDGVKTVYEMQYHLIPEPENEHDKNAVAVYVENKNDEGEIKFGEWTYFGLTKIGYMPASYTATHPITDVMTVTGTLTDHSNGHFKTISYVMDMDTEALNKKLATEMNPEKYTYQMPFTLNGSPKPDAADYLNNQRDWTEQLNNELEYWGVNGHADNVKFDFPGARAGMVTVESTDKLNDEAMQVCGSYFRHCLESGISGDLKRDGYVEGLSQTQPAVNTRERTYFSMQAQPSFADEDDFAKAIEGLSGSSGTNAPPSAAM